MSTFCRLFSLAINKTQSEGSLCGSGGYEKLLRGLREGLGYKYVCRVVGEVGLGGRHYSGSVKEETGCYPGAL